MIVWESVGIEAAEVIDIVDEAVTGEVPIDDSSTVGKSSSLSAV